TEAGDDEAALPEKLWDEGEREHATELEAAGLRDACENERSADAPTGGLRAHGERADLGQIRGEHRERAAPEKTSHVLRDQEVPHVLEQEVARSLEHPVLRGVAIDDLADLVDVRDAGRTDGDAHKSARRASSSASRTRAGTAPPSEPRAARTRSKRISSTALSAKRAS